MLKVLGLCSWNIIINLFYPYKFKCLCCLVSWMTPLVYFRFYSSIHLLVRNLVWISRNLEYQMWTTISETMKIVTFYPEICWVNMLEWLHSCEFKRFFYWAYHLSIYLTFVQILSKQSTLAKIACMGDTT